MILLRPYYCPAVWQNPVVRLLVQQLSHSSSYTFVYFIPEFEQCLADADGSEWPEDVKQDRLHEAISPKILEAMVERT